MSINNCVLHSCSSFCGSLHVSSTVWESRRAGEIYLQFVNNYKSGWNQNIFLALNFSCSCCNYPGIIQGTLITFSDVNLLFFVNLCFRALKELLQICNDNENVDYKLSVGRICVSVIRTSKILIPFRATLFFSIYFLFSLRSFIVLLAWCAGIFKNEN